MMFETIEISSIIIRSTFFNVFLIFLIAKSVTALYLAVPFFLQVFEGDDVLLRHSC